jgi:hypothetical protein
MPLPESVRISVESSFVPGDVFLAAFWTPPGHAERMLIIGSANRRTSPDLIAAQSSLHNLLLHVYEEGVAQGRADEALGF